MRDDLNLDEFKRLLEERLAAIRQDREAQRQEGAPVELDQTKVGRLSRMDAMQQQAMAQASVRRSELELLRIRTALDRLRSGDYGYCTICGEEIAEKRLRVDPATLVCIDCARAAEKNNGVAIANQLSAVPPSARQFLSSGCTSPVSSVPPLHPGIRAAIVSPGSGSGKGALRPS